MAKRPFSSNPGAGAQTVYWVLYDGEKKGSETQCRGLAAALQKGLELPSHGSQHVPSPPAERVSSPVTLGDFPIPSAGFLKFLPRRWWRFFFKSGKGLLATLAGHPAPTLVISSGTRASGVAAHLKTLPAFAQTRFINILNPRLPLTWFDLVLVPHHDGVTGPNVMSFVGGLHGLTREILARAKQDAVQTYPHAPHPRVVLLLGGPSSSFAMKPAVFETLGQQISHLYKVHKGSFFVSFSRRTPPAYKAAFLAATKHVPLSVYDPLVEHDPNPYGLFLALADYILVTADSLSMTTEACYTGKPVLVVGGDKGMPPKFQRFHGELMDRGSTRAFKGSLQTWNVVPVGDLERLVTDIKAFLDL